MTTTEHQNALMMAQIILADEKKKAPLTAETIAWAADKAIAVMPMWRTLIDRDALISDLQTRETHWIGKASVLEVNDDHVAWLDAERKTNWRLWGRYKDYLRKNLSLEAIEGLDEITDQIIERIEDPSRVGSWDRRGLVVGHVQSGKTSNYTGVICKAADAGYKVIIVLAGVHKNLRSQTQMRLDEGFLGYETLPGVTEDKLKPIGVGLIDSDPKIRPHWVTNRADNGDLSRKVANQLGISAGDRPLLFVVKKNKSVLDAVLRWVNNNADESGIVYGVPLLMIDDEADHASVDTKEKPKDQDGSFLEDHDPTAINAGIRQILKRFDQSAYIGYTATPFANIFIHDEGRTKDEGEDLFPRSFIVNLPTPSNYDGPSRMFGIGGEEGEENAVPPLPLIREVKDHAASLDDEEDEGWVPPKHKPDHNPVIEGPEELPGSLKEAIRAFALVVAARRARGHDGAHNSMLVHVTRYTSVQKQVSRQVKAELKDIQIRLRRGDPRILGELGALWNDDFVPTSVKVRAIYPDVDAPDLPFSQLEQHLALAVEDIHVKEINGTAKDILDYEVHKGKGFNVIAIGGDKLARGLTLEGLSVSYFLRASRMYDTLMQMGRWFGYRPGYLDLCRLYTTRDLSDWFSHVTEASEELRREFDHMQAVGGTPKQYGLKVKSHPSIAVTSKVKMRDSMVVPLVFAGELQETVTFYRDPKRLDVNRRAVENLIRDAGAPSRSDISQSRSGSSGHEWKGTFMWEDVEAEKVIDFLDSYATHPSSVKVNSGFFARYVLGQNGKGDLKRWTIVMLGGEGRPYEIAGIKGKAVERSLSERIPLERQEAEQRFVIRRLLGSRDETIDLAQDEFDRALAETIAEWEKDKEKSRRKSAPVMPSGRWIRKARGERSSPSGLLLLYPLTPKVEGYDGPDVIYGYGISFPVTGNPIPVDYVVSNIYWKQQQGELE